MASIKKVLTVLIVLFSAQTVFSQERNDCSGKTDEVLGVYVVDFPEVDPQFPGGEAALKKYIADNLIVPQEERTMGEATTSVVEFVVDANGNVVGIGIQGKGFMNYNSLDRAIMKIALKMPKWTAGLCNEQAVAVRVKIPVTMEMARTK